MIPAHAGQPTAPHDLWTAWHVDPLLIAGLLLTAWIYHHGGRNTVASASRWRVSCFAVALLVVAVALLSPLDAQSGALASAHMVQHLLLTVVAAPLLAIGAPWTRLLRGIPRDGRRLVVRARRRLRLTHRRTERLYNPALAWMLHIGTLWFWHAAVPYDAALERDSIHAVEHASFLLTSLLFWVVIFDSRRTSPGLGVLLLFGAAMQGVFLSALLTFATTPWYDGYAETTFIWGIDHLADQQLAGVIMWIPGGLVYLATAMTLLARWIRDSESAELRLAPGRPSAGTTSEGPIPLNDPRETPQ